MRVSVGRSHQALVEGQRLTTTVRPLPQACAVSLPQPRSGSRQPRERERAGESLRPVSFPDRRGAGELVTICSGVLKNRTPFDPGRTNKRPLTTRYPPAREPIGPGPPGFPPGATRLTGGATRCTLRDRRAADRRPIDSSALPLRRLAVNPLAASRGHSLPSRSRPTRRFV